MAVYWHLKTYIATAHRIYRATDLQKRIITATGVTISIQNICNLLNSKPKSVKLKTLELVCTALNCQMSDFCQVKPDKKPIKKLKKLSPQNSPRSKRLVNQFPDPRTYDHE